MQTRTDAATAPRPQRDATQSVQDAVRPAPMQGEPTSRLGAVLRELRQRARMTQEQLAGLSTISIRAIRDLEQGRVATPRQDTIRLLTNALRLGPAARTRLEQAACPDATTEAGADAPPPALRRLLGRDGELRASVELLGSGATRVLQVTGLPGVGKTRLAQQIATAVCDEHGFDVVWAGIDAGTDALHTPIGELVAQGVADGALASSAGAIAALINDRPTLLVLDGDDAGRCAPTELAALLAACPNLAILVTARACVEVPGAARVTLTGLATGTGDDAALELMIVAARCACPGLALGPDVQAWLAQTCRDLDGVPQAIEQAAGWLALSSPRRVCAAVADNPLSVVGDRFAEQLRAELPPRRSRLGSALETLAGLPDGWTLYTAADALDASFADTAHTIRDLLQQGFVRRHPGAAAEDPDLFAILNLVRHAIHIATLRIAEIA